MHDVLVEIKGLFKRFDAQKEDALHAITTRIEKGKITGLVGPDGAGKTTLIRLLAGLLTPTSGSIQVADADTIRDAEYVHYLTGYMPQRFGLYEELSVLQNLDLYANLRNVVGKEKKEQFEKLLHFTGLTSFTDRLARNLSGGMKQKLGLACALIKKPTLLLLDEPSVGVDPLSRRELWTMVMQLLEDDIAVVWSSAYLDEAEKCDALLLLDQGRLLYDGDPKALTKKMEGRVFVMTNIQGDRRQRLFDLLQHPAVLDGTIQGRDVRLVLKKGQCMEDEMASNLKPVPPRFEDAFIDILGGGPSGASRLAEATLLHEENGIKPIVAEKLTKKFKNFTATDQLSLSIEKGEIFGLLGPNGAGKTTTFKMLCGLLRPTDGKAFVNGVDLQKAPSHARAQIGYMAQKFSLYGNLTVEQNLEFFAGAYNLHNKKKKDAILQMTEIFSFEPYLSTLADTLPLGYKQRLSLACSCMHHPKILFLDEPTSGVDPITRREFWNHINGLVNKGVTILITTHFMDEAEYCDRIALVYQGKIIKMDTPNALKDAMRSQEMPNPTLEEVFIQMLEERASNGA